ncbi:VPLPA-CTERM sorting domain-containing protein [Poriferisphaera sp. WC338]|uniref:VPLPA-CTERM sorting domain-containing protein n=1 Tax=Poriferisphaera sp. WC338 TaxID=3425129 RepID=UPI003D812D62
MMKFKLTTLFGGAAALMIAGSAQANLLTDGGFEAATDQFTHPNWTMVTNTPDPGSPTAQSARFQNSGWASFPHGVPGKGVWFRGFLGKSAAATANAKVTQAVAQAGAAGQTYTLTAKSRIAENFNINPAVDSQAILAIDFLDASMNVIGTSAIDVYDTAQTNGTLQPSLGADNSLWWFDYSVSGTAVAGTAFVQARLEMIDGLDASISGDQAALFDDLVLTVPEPASAMLALTGLFGLAGLRRRSA